MPGRPQVFPALPPGCPQQQMLGPCLPPPHLPARLTHTSTMMTMSLGDEAPWIYLPGEAVVRARLMGLLWILPSFTHILMQRVFIEQPYVGQTGF